MELQRNAPCTLGIVYRTEELTDGRDRRQDLGHHDHDNVPSRTFDRMMRNTRTALVLLAACIALSYRAQSTYQLVLEGLGHGDSLVYNDAALFVDGSVVMLFRSRNDSINPTRTVVTKVSPDGSILWARSYGSEAILRTQRVVAMPDGGLASFAPLLNFSGPVTYQLDRFDQGGDLLWSKRYEATIDMYDYGYSSAKALADGGIVMNLGLFHIPTFIRTDADGNPVWARSYRTIDEDPGVKTPTFDFVVTDDGGLVITEKAIFDMMLTRTDGDGVVQWTHRYACGQYTHTKTAAQLVNQDLLVAGYVNEYDEVPFIARLDSTGNIIWARSYSGLDIADGFQHIVELSNGDILLSGRQRISSDLCLRISASGEPLERVYLDATFSDPAIEIIGLDNGLPVFAGQARITSNDASGQRFHLWRLDPSYAGSCGLGTENENPTDYLDFSSSYDVSDGIEVAEQEISLSTPTTISESLMLTSEELCATLAVSGPIKADRLAVRPSLVQAGEEFSVSMDSEGGTLSVVSPDGRVVNSSPGYATSSNAIATTGWARGCYLVYLRDAKCRILGSARISVW